VQVADFHADSWGIIPHGMGSVKERRRLLGFATSADCATIPLMSARLLAALWLSLLSLAAVALLWPAHGPARAQNPAGDLLALVNKTRLSQGLYPYVINPELTAAAQRHSDDMAATGQISHTGSDGSSDVQRILDAGYGAYEFGPLVGENIYGGPGGAQAPFNAWMDTPGARANLLHEKYREVGIGVAGDDQGRTFWTVTFGAQPNVLPVLVNDGAGSVDAITVTLTLLPENAVPDGLGTAMGQPLEYRASTDSQFSGVEWEPWAERVSFVLDETPGRQTVYVQLRDAAGRTAISWVIVTLTGLEVTVTPTEPVETGTPGTATPSATATHTPTVSPTPVVTATATGTPTPTVTATTRPSLTATSTPVPSATTTPPPTATASATSVPSPTPTIPATGTPTHPPPTTRPPGATVASPAPTRPIPSGAVVEEEPEPSSLASRVAPWALGLQVVALMLGVYVALRRPGE
jgi:uncharacterized protein YkwD